MNGHEFDLDMRRTRRPRFIVPGANDQRLGLTVTENPMRRRQTALWIEHHAQRVWAVDLARGESGIVAGNGTGPDHNRVAQCAHTVQVNDVQRARYETGVAASRRNVAVDALPKVRHTKTPFGASATQRQV